MKIVTIHNLGESKAEEVLEFLLAHIKGMKEQSKEDGNCACSYLTSSGKKCPGGALIPDTFEWYKERDKCTMSWHAFVFHYNISKNHKSLISAVQNLHDSERNWNEKGFIFDCLLISQDLRGKGVDITPKMADVINKYCGN
jgi:hypothetical protein